MSKKRNTYKEFFGIREEKYSDQDVQNAEEMAAAYEKIADAAKEMSDEDKAELKAENEGIEESEGVEENECIEEAISENDIRKIFREEARKSEEIKKLKKEADKIISEIKKIG